MGWVREDSERENKNYLIVVLLMLMDQKAPSTSSSSSASNDSGLSGNQKAFLETVSFAEGTKQKGYNTWFGNKLFPENQPDLSQYTINQIVDLQNRFLAEGHGTFNWWQIC